ncbi:hypothetical protein Hanom_Chr05g00439971 [Helianthus anomalus]
MPTTVIKLPPTPTPTPHGHSLKTNHRPTPFLPMNSTNSDHYTGHHPYFISTPQVFQVGLKFSY